ncbi:MAG: hypothetical protein HYV24_01690 [Deltaproteobacteria bacterium]|nr:hypothetical protein [Deltaproteobacteria bacterium]
MTKKIFKYIIISAIVLISLSIIGIASIVILLWGHCFFSNHDSVQSVRTKLLNGIESYQTQEEFESYLAKNSFQWQKEPEDFDTEDPIKSIHIRAFDTIIVKNYKHHDFYMDLRVSFFYNRLMEVLWTPDETKADKIRNYTEAIMTKDHVSFKKEDGEILEADLEPYTRIIVNNRKNEWGGFVNWMDTRLFHEYSKWEMCHD